MFGNNCNMTNDIIVFNTGSFITGRNFYERKTVDIKNKRLVHRETQFTHKK